MKYWGVVTMADTYNGKYKNFMFMAGWRDVLEGFEQEFGSDYAREALWNLMLVGTLEGQEVTSNKPSIKGFVEGCISPVVKNSAKNYNKNRENGLKGGRPKIEIDMGRAYELYNGGMTWTKVAKELGVSVDKLRAARKECESEKPKNRKIETEKPDPTIRKTEKPEQEFFVEEVKNPLNDKKGGKTEKPKNSYEIAGFSF